MFERFYDYTSYNTMYMRRFNNAFEREQIALMDDITKKIDNPQLKQKGPVQKGKSGKAKRW